VGAEAREVCLVRRGGDRNDTKSVDDGCWRWVGRLNSVMGLRIYDTVCLRRAASPAAPYGWASVKSKEMRNSCLSTTLAPKGHANEVLEHVWIIWVHAAKNWSETIKGCVLAESISSMGGATVRRNMSNAGRGKHCKVVHRVWHRVKGEVKGHTMHG